MKTLYEILEVSENASKEVIEKAYKVLAKRYHPDLQDEKNKKNAEENMKKINEAFEILMDDQKREQYDNELKIDRENRIKEEIERKIKDSNKNVVYKREKEEFDPNKELKNMSRHYKKVYSSGVKNIKRNIFRKRDKREFKDLIITILIMIIICSALWFFPSTNKIIVGFYEENMIIKTIVDVLGNLFGSLAQGISNVFTGAQNFENLAH